ncbi:hypothetical protein GOP47_0006449 [Adiantum capillus-veneris]|uniref:N-acetyltransferase domain-containing protein n=1 Tax=Adiantum capillus-veneris TaxID=13818 RepID=A0A9D4V338_ADICA|nr:hypothetical protein GOP47_0006449 [Adiantum capillus-veneris]
MGLATPSSQLSSTTLCWQKRELRTSRPKASGVRENRLQGKLSSSVASRTAHPLPYHRGSSSIIVADARSETNEITVTGNSTTGIETSNGPLSVTQDAGGELPKHERLKATNPQNSAPNVCMSSDIPDEATTRADVVAAERGELVNFNSLSFSSRPFDYAGAQIQPAEGSSNATTFNTSSATSPSNATNLPSAHSQDDGDSNDAGSRHDATTSHILSNAGEKETKGEIRRFSLSEPELLKTLQESKSLTPLEKINLEKIMKFKVINDNLQGQLAIQAMRTEQIKDLENLLTDSYSELMWGPLTYRPVLAWILSSYLRERQACLPNAVTLVGLYKPCEEAMANEQLARKWWLAGAVEISFNAGGKPKDMQAPLPPEDAPFLSNMAVLKNFRRRGIGRELLKAAEELALEMGGTEMYLHCRMVDEAPLNMYKSSGYSVVETDSILSLLLFQRRRHLMYKRLVEPV